MANTKQTKKYLGGWDTSAYDDLSKASRQAYETNWDILKDRFANLMAEADAKQQEAVRNYSNTLANQTDSTFNAQRAIDQNLSNRGLAESGVRNLINQEQTRAVGNSTNKALGKLMNSTSDIINAQIGGVNDLISGGNKLNERQLADQLDILADKQAADMEGQQLAAQLAEQEAARAAARGGSGSGGADEESDEKLRQLQVWSILNNIDPDTGEALEMTDGQKAFVLDTMYNVKNAKDVVSGFNSKILGKSPTDEKTSEYKAVQKTKKKLSDYEKKLNKAEYEVANGINRATNVPYRNAMLNLVSDTKSKLDEQLNKYYNTKEYKEKLDFDRLNNISLDDYYKMVYSKK